MKAELRVRMLVWMTEGPQALRDSQPPDGKLAGVPLLETGRELGSGGAGTRALWGCSRLVRLIQLILEPCLE